MKKVNKIAAVLEKVSLLSFILVALILAVGNGIFLVIKFNSINVMNDNFGIIFIILVLFFIIIFSWSLISRSNILPFVNSLILLVSIVAIQMNIDQKGFINMGFSATSTVSILKYSFYAILALYAIYLTLTIYKIVLKRKDKRDFDEAGIDPNSLIKLTLYTLGLVGTAYYVSAVIYKKGFDVSFITLGVQTLLTAFTSSTLMAIVIGVSGAIYLILWITFIIDMIKSHHADIILIILMILLPLIIVIYLGSNGNMIGDVSTIENMATSYLVMFIILAVLSFITLVFNMIQVIKDFIDLLKSELVKNAPVFQVQYKEVEEKVIEDKNAEILDSIHEEDNIEVMEEQKVLEKIVEGSENTEQDVIVTPTYQPLESSSETSSEELREQQLKKQTQTQELAQEETPVLTQEQTPVLAQEEQTQELAQEEQTQELAQEQTPVLTQDNSADNIPTPIDLGLTEPLNTYHHDAQERLLSIEGISYSQENNNLIYKLDDKDVALIETGSDSIKIYSIISLDQLDTENVNADINKNENASIYPSFVTVKKSKDNQNARKYLRRLVDKLKK